MPDGTAIHMPTNTDLRELRIAAGLTQSQLADRLGLKQNTVSQYEKGNRKVDADTLAAWVEACGARLEIIPAGQDPIGRVPTEIMPEIRPLLEAYASAPARVRDAVRLLLQAQRAL